MLTGKGIEWSGALVRTEATGYGTAFFLREMLAARGEDLTDRTCLVSGSGNVALYATEKAQQLGATVVACSDSDGVAHDPRGIDVDLLQQVKEVERGRVEDYVERRGRPARYLASANIWDIPCDLAMPCATQNELTGRDGRCDAGGQRLRGGRRGRNMPTTPEGIEVFVDAGVAFGPGKAANAGGVATSALEMQQNASRDRWTFEQTEQRLAEIMTHIHQLCHETAEEYGAPGDYVRGANIAGFQRVADAMVALGLV